MCQRDNGNGDRRDERTDDWNQRCGAGYQCDEHGVRNAHQGHLQPGDERRERHADQRTAQEAGPHVADSGKEDGVFAPVVIGNYLEHILEPRR